MKGKVVTLLFCFIPGPLDPNSETNHGIPSNHTRTNERAVVL
jgi:hypothetical protein